MPSHIDITDIPLVEGLPKSVKPVSRVTTHEGVEHHLAIRIAEHPDYEKVKEPLVHGWSCARSAEYVQDRLDLFNDVNLSLLENALKEVRKDIPREDFVRTSLPSLHQKAVETVMEGLDVLEELKSLYELQKERVGIDFRIEKNVQKLFPGTHREVKAAREILKTYAEVQMDFGMVKRQLGQLEVEAVSHPNGAVAEVASDPKRRHKLLGMANRMLALGMKKEKEAAEECSAASDEAA